MVDAVSQMRPLNFNPVLRHDLQKLLNPYMSRWKSGCMGVSKCNEKVADR